MTRRRSEPEDEWVTFAFIVAGGIALIVGAILWPLVPAAGY